MTDTAQPATDAATRGAAGGLRTAVARLARDVDALFTALDANDDGVGIGVIADLLATADRCRAAAVEGLSGLAHRGVLVDEGITTGTCLRVYARRTAAEEKSLGCLAERLVDMPVLRGWYRDAVVSDGVVRAIVWAVRNLTKAQRRWVDETLRGNRGRIGDLGADELVGAVQRLADQARPELCRDRQRRAFDRRSVTAQPRLDGTGGLLLADLDAEGFETVITALDTFTGTGDDTDIADGANATDTDDDGGRRSGDTGGDRGGGGDGGRRSGDTGGDRGGDGGGDQTGAIADDGAGDGGFGPRDRWRRGIGRQRADAMVNLLNHHATTSRPHRDGGDADGHTHGRSDGDGAAGHTDGHSGGGHSDGGGRVDGRAEGGGRVSSQASLLILTDVAALTDRDHPDHPTALLLTRLTNGPVELVPSMVQRHLCDATLRLVFTDGVRVLGATAAHPRVSATLKAAVIARDGECRFPGCRASARVCDIHHLIPVSQGGVTRLDNLALVCPQHHHAIHDGGWTARLDSDDDSITFTRRGVTVTTLAHHSRRLTAASRPPSGRPTRRRQTRGSPPAHAVSPARGSPPSSPVDEQPAPDQPPPQPALPF
jgi:hypothetical protein